MGIAMQKITKKLVLRSLLYLAGLIILSILGITSGVIIASNTTFFNSFMTREISPIDLINKSDLSIGDAFPSINTIDSYRQVVNIDTILSNRSTLIGIVSEGCEPCQEFVQSLIDEGFTSEADCQLLLFSSDPEFFSDKYHVKTFYISEEFIQLHDINAYPTIIGVSKHSEIMFVSSGYIQMINSSFISQHL